MSEILDLPFYAKNFLKIVTKQSKLESLEFNSYQLEIARVIKELQDAGKPVRIIILKCRQIGGSTFGGAFNFHEVVTNPFRNGLVIAHDEDSTTKLFTMCKRFYDFLPEKMKPMKRFSNKKELKFENPNEEDRGGNPGLMSGLEVETANNLNAGRGSPVQNLHISELAFWKNAGTVLTGLFQAVPYEPNTSVIIESTANGVAGNGQEFYERCRQAMQGQSDFKFIFFKWTHNPQYEIDPPSDFKLTDYEKELKEIHPELNERKFAWRRYKIENEMGKTLMEPEDQFRQEYPLTPEEAFISSGRPVFNVEKVNRHIEKLRDLKYEKVINVNGKKLLGELRIYRRPEDGKGFAVGADVAEGIESGDFSTMSILSKKLEQVASYHAHVHPDQFGAELLAVGELFNNALLSPEVNNHGLTTLTHITNKNYPHVFMREVYDERADKYVKKVGWQTNAKTKPMMLDEFVAAYRDNLVKINDIELLREMATLTLEPDGSVNLNGRDRVVSICIALQAIKQVHEVKTSVFDTARPKTNFKTLEEMLESSEGEESYFD